jgi:hypothetical protein
MKKNMGGVDRGIRIITALVIATVYFGEQVSGTLGSILGVVALLLVLTSLLGFCPLYAPFGITTIKKQP